MDHGELLTHPGLVKVLDRARRLGFTGDAPPEDHIAHALRFLAPLAGPPSVAGGSPVLARPDPGGPAALEVAIGVDLGSGAGLPGLVLALALPHSRWTLVEAMARRAEVLVDAVDQLGLAGRVEVWHGRAEDFAREQGRRGVADLVTARGFAAPAPTAECAAPLLRAGGLLVVSEPPESDGSRWLAPGLDLLGLSPLGVVEGVAVCQARGPCPEDYPRRVGMPAKRPLF